MTDTMSTVSSTAVQRAGRTTYPAAPVRLTRRGRLVFLLLLLTVLFVGFSIGRVSSLASTSAPRPAVRHTVIVRQGQTLWSLARQLRPDADPRVVVAALQRVNSLDATTPIAPGQELVLP
jgi:LysM repeat protein